MVRCRNLYLSPVYSYLSQACKTAVLHPTISYPAEHEETDDLCVRDVSVPSISFLNQLCGITLEAPPIVTVSTRSLRVDVKKHVRGRPQRLCARVSCSSSNRSTACTYLLVSLMIYALGMCENLTQSSPQVTSYNHPFH